MKRMLCLLIILATLLPIGTSAEGKAKNAALSLEDLLSLSYQTTRDDFIQRMKAIGGKINAAGQDVGVTRISIAGVPVQRLSAWCGRDGENLQYIEIEVEPNGSATYMQPGDRYDKLLAAVEACLGQQTSEMRLPTSYRQLWSGSSSSAELAYFSGRREQRKRIALFIYYPNPQMPATTPEPWTMPAPKAFAWPIHTKTGKAGEVRLNMTRDQVKAVEAGILKSDKGDMLQYDGLLGGHLTTRVSYRFDEADKLVGLSIRFTRRPYDPSDGIYDFQAADRWLRDDCFGAPEQADPMVWATDHGFDPLDGSTWIKAVQKSALIYRSDWVVGGVRVAHILDSENGRVAHTIVCGVAQ